MVLTVQETKALEDRITRKQLNDQDVDILLGLLDFRLWVEDQLSRAKLTIARLKRLLGFASESRKKAKPPSDSNGDNPGDPPSTTDEANNLR